MSLLRPGVIKQHKRHFSVTCTVDVISFPQLHYSHRENNIRPLSFIRWEDQSNHKQLSVTLWSVSDKATEHQLNVPQHVFFYIPVSDIGWYWSDIWINCCQCVWLKFNSFLLFDQFQQQNSSGLSMIHIASYYNTSSGEGIVALYAATNPFLLNKICLNQHFILQHITASYYNTLIITLAGTWAIIKVSGHQYQWFAGGYDLGNRNFWKWLAWWLPGG